MLGNLAVGTGETGPFLALEQVVVTRSSTREGLTRALSLYNLTGYVASALGSALVTRLTGSPTWVFALFLVSFTFAYGTPIRNPVRLQPDLVPA